ncbi:transmembrane and coiled-coil domain 2 protein Dmtn isoform X5 [Rhodnius prolixus]|uniref:transmembrane and coiled-coil domain 2 protein Dmtn isoform X5 n=1 Tax=Rhodnius prolixus TaxID=13249 RepID=UPI003D18AAEE
MDNLNINPKSRSPSPCRLSSAPKSNNTGSFRESRMSGGSGAGGGRCKSPSSSTSRHERCSSTDAGMLRCTGVVVQSTSAGLAVGGGDLQQHGNQGDDGGLPTVYGQTGEDEADVSGVLNGSVDLGDDADGRRAAIEHMHNKIARTRELIKGEQTARDDNVNEYLKLASNADKTQVQRIKAIFEKKNQKSAQSIQQLQKKLDSYNKKLRDLESRMNTSAGASSGGGNLHQSERHHHRQPREVLRDVGQGLKHVGGNIRDGIIGLPGSVMSKPREFAHLIRNKFGSADNINSLSKDEKTHHGSATLPGGCSLGSGLKFTSEEGSECSSVTSESMAGGGGATATAGVSHQASTSPMSNSGGGHPGGGGGNSGRITLETVYVQLQTRKRDVDALSEKIDYVREGLQNQIAYLNQALQEERFRSERLEEQVNDLTELHQNEVENLKTAISDMEEKVQYQSEERLSDITDMLESCQTKISKMEHQQAQHQQYLTLEGLDNSNARALVVKLINVVLTVLQVVLLLVATIAGIIMPFLRTRLRVLSSAVLVISLVIVMKQWPEISDIARRNLSAAVKFSQHNSADSGN